MNVVDEAAVVAAFGDAVRRFGGLEQRVPGGRGGGHLLLRLSGKSTGNILNVDAGNAVAFTR